MRTPNGHIADSGREDADTKNEKAAAEGGIASEGEVERRKGNMTVRAQSFHIDVHYLFNEINAKLRGGFRRDHRHFTRNVHRGFLSIPAHSPS